MKDGLVDLLVNLVWLHLNVKEHFVHLKTWDQVLLPKKVVLYASFLGEGAVGQDTDKEAGGIAAWGSKSSNQETRVVWSWLLWSLVVLFVLFLLVFFCVFLGAT